MPGPTFNSKNGYRYLIDHHDEITSVATPQEKVKSITHPSVFPHANARELAIHLDFTTHKGAGLLRWDDSAKQWYFDDTFPAALPQYARTTRVVHVLVTFGRSFQESIPIKVDQSAAVEALAGELKHFTALKDLDVKFVMPNKTLNKGQLGNSQYLYGVGFKKWNLKAKVGEEQVWREWVWESPEERELFNMYRRSTRPRKQIKAKKEVEQKAGPSEEVPQKSS